MSLSGQFASGRRIDDFRICRALPAGFCRLYRIFELLNSGPSIEKIGRGLQEILLVESSNRLFHVEPLPPRVNQVAIWPKKDRQGSTAAQPAPP